MGMVMITPAMSYGIPRDKIPVQQEAQTIMNRKLSRRRSGNTKLCLLEGAKPSVTSSSRHNSVRIYVALVAVHLTRSWQPTLYLRTCRHLHHPP